MRLVKRSPWRSSVFSIRRMSERSEPRPMITRRAPPMEFSRKIPSSLPRLNQFPMGIGSGFIHQSPHALDGGTEADEDRLADQEVTDVELHQLRDGGDRLH